MFAFNFSGEDVEDSEEQATEQNTIWDQSCVQSAATPTAQVPVQIHTLKDLLATLPDQLSYTTTQLTSSDDRSVPIPRRAFFDVRMQLMAETNPDTTSHLLNNPSDLQIAVYEGGLKTWESATDLAQYLLERAHPRDTSDGDSEDAVVELGCGTALPSLVMFQQVIRTGGNTRLVLQDYNEEVLRLVTVPNLLLLWALVHSDESMLPTLPEYDGGKAAGDEGGELEVTPELLERFELDLLSKGVDVMLISGPWSERMNEKLVTALQGKHNVLVLAAETIYSPASTEVFSNMLERILGQAKNGRGLIAAKRIYFGIGGSIDTFKESMLSKGVIAREVADSDVGRSGVGRCIIEVQRS